MNEALPKAVLITGAARRIGRAIALDFAQNGWAVALHGRTLTDELQALARELGARGTRAVALAADLAKESEVATLVPRAREALGPLGGLVNNASVFEYDSLESATRASWDLHLETNLRAPFTLIQSFARQVPADGHGAVVNLIDQRVWSLTPHFVTYTVSKAGLWTLTQTLALALAPRIRVNAIGPGPTLKSTHQTDAQFQAQVDSMPLRRGTSPDEIAAAVRFLFHAPAMTGQMLALDGGQHLGWAQSSDNGGPKD